MPGALMITPQEAASVFNLDAAGYKPKQIAAEVGISRPSVYDILGKHGRWGEIADGPVFDALRRDQNKTLEAAFRAAAVESLENAHKPEKLAKASYFQLVLGSATEIDKARLLAGESTQNIAVQHDVAEITEDIAEKLARSLLRFSTAVLDPRNGPIDVTPTASETKVESQVGDKVGD